MRIAKLKSAYNSIIQMLFILKTMLLVLSRWIHLASGHRCVLGLVIDLSIVSYFVFLVCFKFSCLLKINNECSEFGQKVP